MKTFIASLALVALILVFIFLNMAYINKTIDEMLDILYLLPSDSESFESMYDGIGADVQKLWDMWDENIGKIAFTIGYDNMNRADDAIMELYASYKTKTDDIFVSSKIKFTDNLKRLKNLENFNIQSIF